MTWTLKWKSGVEKDARKLPDGIRERAFSALAAAVLDPHPFTLQRRIPTLDVKYLDGARKNDPPAVRIRIGEYRVEYWLQEREREIEVYYAGPRGDAYGKKARRRNPDEQFVIPNPATPGGLKPVHLVTDRALRYRAQRAIAPGPELCVYCGGKSTMVDHVNGREEDTAEANLVRACRSCNTAKGVTLRNAGIGRLTRQYNPGKEQGATSLAQWVMAVSSVRRRDKRTGRLLAPDAWKSEIMPVREAVAMIRATPHSRRVEFAAQLAAKRRPRSTKDWEVPF